MSMSIFFDSYTFYVTVAVGPYHYIFKQMAKIERNLIFGQSVDALPVLQWQPFLGQYKLDPLLYNNIQ